MLVTGGNPERFSQVIDCIRGGIATHFAVQGEPTVDDLRDAVEAGRRRSIDGVVSIGGGSVLDLAKGLSGVITNSGDPEEFLEGSGRPARKMASQPLWHLAIPTTAGTGSEMTRNAVFLSSIRGVKASIRHELMIPDVALIDPSLLASCPQRVASSSGMDTLVHLLESGISRRATTNSRRISVAGLRLAMAHLPQFYDDPAAPVSARAMATASTLGGIALAEAGLGVVHGLAAPIGSVTRAPHGAVCAALVGAGLRMNLQVMASTGSRSTGESIPETIRDVVIGSRFGPEPGGFAEAVVSVIRRLGCSKLGELGLRAEQVAGVATAALQSSSMRSNPVDLDFDQLTTIILES